jgi:hypothetical protein
MFSQTIYFMLVLSIWYENRLNWMKHSVGRKLYVAKQHWIRLNGKHQYFYVSTANQRPDWREGHDG